MTTRFLLVLCLCATPLWATTPIAEGEQWTDEIQLSPGDILQGSGARTVLHPASPWGTVLHVTGGLVADPQGAVPHMTIVRDLTIACDGKRGYGIIVESATVRLENITIRGCYLNLVLSNAVNVTISGAVLTHGYVNLYIPPAPVTTIVVTGSSIREADIAIYLQGGQGVTFTNRTIVESNVIGVWVEATARDIVFDQVWFENNGTNLTGAGAAFVTVR